LNDGVQVLTVSSQIAVSVHVQ